MDIPILVVQEIGRLNLELLIAQQRIRELEQQIAQQENNDEQVSVLQL